MRNHLRPAYPVLLLILVLPLSIWSLEKINFHPEELSKQNTLYNYGNSAFAVDYWKTPTLRLAPSLEYLKGYQKSYPDQYMSYHAFSISDLNDPYLGFFYPLTIFDNPALLGVNFNVRFEWTKYGGNPDYNYSLYKESKILFSSKTRSFYYSASAYFQNFTKDNTMHDYSFKTNTPPPAFLPHISHNNFSQTNLFYELGLGYIPHKDSRIGLVLNNQYKPNQELIPEILSQAEILGDTFVPFMCMNFFQSNLYRFNYGGQNESVYAFPPHSPSMNSNRLFEKTTDVSTYHAKLQYEYRLSWLHFLLFSDYRYVKYQSNLDTHEEYGTPGILTWYHYQKQGSFHNLDYTLILNPQLSKDYAIRKWHLNIKLTQLLYSRIQETIKHLSTDDAPVVANDHSTRLKTHFQRDKIEITLGYTTPIHEIWTAFTSVSGQTHITEYSAPSSWGMNIFPGFYPSMDEFVWDFAKRDFNWDAKQLVFANRYKLKHFHFDAALGFLEAHNDTDDYLKMTVLSPSLAVTYFGPDHWQFKLQYLYDIYLRFLNYTEAKAQGFKLTFYLQKEF